MSVIEAGDLKIGYTERGAKSGLTPLVFLHGVGSDKSVWGNQLDFFGRKRRTVALDYPGYGESELPAGDLTRGEIARYLRLALNFLQIEKAHFCGLSMGGIIALEIYSQQPEIVGSLILANTFARHPDGAEIVARSLKFIETNSMRDFAAQRVENLLASQTSAEIRENVIETMGRINKKSYAWATTAVWQADYLYQLAVIKAPTLVIGGDSDKPTPPELSRQLADGIPNAKLAIIEDAGHLSNLDQPEIFNELIQNHLTAVDG